nr:SCO6880 family protein [Streptomyces sp. NRRL F-4489]
MSDNPQAEATTATVKFPHRSRRGILLGLTAPQLIVASLTGLLLLAVLLTRGVVGALELIPLWAAIALLVFVRYRGRALADWAPIVTRYVLRRMRGQLIWLTRPSRRPVREGLLHLPGTAASLRVVTAPDRRYGAVHNPHTGTLTAVVKVSSRAYALLDPGTQNANVNGWGRALASLARTGQVARIQVIERTVPDSGDALRRYWEEHGQPDAPVAGAVYSELIQSAGPVAAPHEAYVAVSLDAKAARRLINQAGGGLMLLVNPGPGVTSAFKTWLWS